MRLRQKMLSSCFYDTTKHTQRQGKLQTTHQKVREQIQRRKFGVTHLFQLLHYAAGHIPQLGLLRRQVLPHDGECVQRTLEGAGAVDLIGSGFLAGQNFLSLNAEVHHFNNGLLIVQVRDNDRYSVQPSRLQASFPCRPAMIS